MAKQLVGRTIQAYPKLTAADLKIDFAFFTAGESRDEGRCFSLDHQSLNPPNIL
jgi:hypothetical protein